MRRAGKIVPRDKGLTYCQCHHYLADVVCEIGEREGDSQIEIDGEEPGGAVRLV